MIVVVYDFVRVCGWESKIGYINLLKCGGNVDEIV